MRLVLVFLLGLTAVVFSATRVSAQTIVNGYARVTSVAGTTLNLSNVNDPLSDFAVGEKAIIMQMQDDVIGDVSNSSSFGDIGSIQSAGLYEVVTIASAAAGSVTLTAPLQNTYNTGVHSSLQLITYPLLDDGGGDYTTTDDITGEPWDGNIGGVIAFRVAGTLTLEHNIVADGIGFRGGVDQLLSPEDTASTGCTEGVFRIEAADFHADKGEGIYRPDLTGNPDYAAGRGKILNGGGGGNSHNAGGGGGSNYSAGGIGGPGWKDGSGDNIWWCEPGAGGLGGTALSPYITASRMFMGGGGGGGEGNNNGATPGGNGGGIIFITANTLVMNAPCSGGIISANGESSASTSAPNPNDGVGGAGAAGSILVNVQNYNIDGSCDVTVEADGGNGGSVSNNGVHGGGGGGGMGVAIFSTPPPSNVIVSTDPGVGGRNNDGTGAPAIPEFADPGDGTPGAGEGAFVDGNTPLPVQLVDFNGFVEGNQVVLTWNTASEINNDYFEVQLSQDGRRFSTIGNVAGMGTTNQPQSYQFSHYNQFNGTLYYRLKQVDFDGSFEYSRAIYVNSNGITEPLNANIFPNPVRGTNARLQVYSQSTESFRVTIFNVLGKAVQSFAIAYDDIDINGFSLRTTSLAKGIYSVEVFQGDSRVVKKLVVE